MHTGFILTVQNGQKYSFIGHHMHVLSGNCLSVECPHRIIDWLILYKRTYKLICEL